MLFWALEHAKANANHEKSEVELQITFASYELNSLEIGMPGVCSDTVIDKDGEHVFPAVKESVQVGVWVGCRDL